MIAAMEQAALHTLFLFAIDREDRVLTRLLGLVAIQMRQSAGRAESRNRSEAQQTVMAGKRTTGKQAAHEHEHQMRSKEHSDVPVPQAVTTPRLPVVAGVSLRRANG